LLPISAASEPAKTIVLKGKRSSYIQVRLHRTVQLDCCSFRRQERNGQTYFAIKGLSVDTRGDYAGFAIERVRDGQMMKGAVRIPAMDLDEGRLPTYISFGRRETLRPGLYRFHLLTDGPATVRVTARGLEARTTLRPQRPTAVAAELLTLVTSIGEQKLQERVAVDVGRESTVLLATKTEGENTQAHYVSHCLTGPGGSCSGEDYDLWLSPGSGGGGGTKIDVFDGTIPSGTYDAVFSARSAGTTEGSLGFVLVLN
jgi:hypothetical protein